MISASSKNPETKEMLNMCEYDNNDKPILHLDTQEY